MWCQLYPVDVSMYGISGFGFEMVATSSGGVNKEM